MRNQIQSYLLLTTLAAIWGGSFLFIKIALGSVTPITIAAGRIGLAALLLYMILRWKGLSLPAMGKHWIYIVAVAMLGNVLPFSLISFGEQHIDSSLAAVLMATIPLFTILIAHFMTSDEKMTAEKTLGVLIGFLGIVILIGPSTLLDLGKQTLAQLMVACGALCYSVTGILSRKLSKLPKLQCAAAILLVASAVIVPASVLLDQPWALKPDPSALISIGILGLLATAVAQLILLKVLDLRNASFLSLNNYLIPLFGVFWGVVFLFERPAPNTGIAFLVILLGVFVSQSGFMRFLRPAANA
ncbi:S-adenosylmethionine/S-adenosylhomocysteine transporter [Pseudovibrio axinellae]|uniref:S-adenosylmethionine/S-adenosylhomocysteine transporter n=1 Tax=Pseudovibrio axinellae TaxID=989403 RepID=A0A165XZD2_9HYPH|nr:EamA family transporter [Pseudovibrio axinellae]KZL18266.1 S-adenosylmethionine/S-adenosylhomocysteine transporter [Pseudovibrio axinellae]SER72563.1 Permease of the drug/metabolite transporter (DMT) superfamily [Pseudovibrio axinellae]